jgi:hypothetical protein
VPVLFIIALMLAFTIFPYIALHIFLCILIYYIGYYIVVLVFIFTVTLDVLTVMNFTAIIGLSVLKRADTS